MIYTITYILISIVAAVIVYRLLKADDPGRYIDCFTYSLVSLLVGFIWPMFIVERAIWLLLESISRGIDAISEKFNG